jgi:tetratricopeptide (TPR) repeat protein
MSRWVLALLLSFAATGLADDLKKERPKPPVSDQEEVPKEEDESLTTSKEYSFNPLQAKKEIRVGDYYFKKGSFRAAVLRFREATKWNAADSEAWLRLGEAAEKQKDDKTVKEAFAKYLELAADAKEAPEIRKKLEKLK